MPAKKVAAAKVAEDASVQKSADPEKVRKVPAHPATTVMVREALTDMDSRKGISSVAIQGFIKQKYPTVDAVRLKHFVRKALKKGLESGTVVRPANSTVTSGVVGKFRLAPKVKEQKPKSENVDPNVQKVKKAKDPAKKKKTDDAKDTEKPKKKAKAAKEPKKDAGKKTSEKESKKDSDKEEAIDETKEEPKAPKEPKKDSAKVAAAKKPKAKAAKTEEKTSAAGKRKAAAGAAATAQKAPGKRGKKTVDE